MAENIEDISTVPSEEPAAAFGEGFSPPTATDGTEVARNSDVITLADREKAAHLIQVRSTSSISCHKQ